MKFGSRSLLLSFVCLVLRGFGQTADPASPVASSPATVKVEMPSDPAALLALAAKKNGLQNAGSAPWHLKATYEGLNDDGSVKETGTLEEFWISAKKHRVIFSSPGFTQTDYTTEDGRYRVGDPARPQGLAAIAQNNLFPFFPSGDMVGRSTLVLADKAIGSAQLKCVTVDTSKPGVAGYAEAYCFTPSAPILRVFEITQGANQILYNNIVQVRGAYVAREVFSSRLGKPQMRVRIDRIEGLPQPVDADFTPPPDAVRLRGPELMGSGVMAGRIIQRVSPIYPAAAKAARVEGTVVLEASIGKDGKIANLQAVSGPKMLIPAAINVVRQWVYEPYLLDGEPVEVGTTINVIYSLSGDFNRN
jgi:TonB family protein